MTTNSPVKAAPTGRDERGFIRRHLGLIAGLALLGACAGVVLALALPAVFHSQVGIEIRVLRGPGSEGDTPAERLGVDAEFVNSITVRDRVRTVIPTAPNAVEVSIDDQRPILRITSEGSSSDEALRLARTWSNAFISARKEALISEHSLVISENQAELDRLVQEIGRARLDADDVEADRLAAVRQGIVESQAAVEADIARLESGAGAEVVESPTHAEDRSGVALLPALVLGLTLGALIGILVGAIRDRGRRREAQTDDWLDDPSFEPIDLVELAASAEHEQSTQAAPRLEDLAPDAEAGTNMSRAAKPIAPEAGVGVSTKPDDGLGPELLGQPEPTVEGTPFAGVDPVLDLSEPTPTCSTEIPDLVNPTDQPSGPKDWLRESPRALGRTRVPTSRRTPVIDVRVVDAARLGAQPGTSPHPGSAPIKSPGTDDIFVIGAAALSPADPGSPDSRPERAVDGAAHRVDSETGQIVWTQWEDDLALLAE